MIKTRLTEMLGIAHPIVSAPMARMSGGRLAGAVSAAGALGTFGAALVAMRIKPAYVHEQVAAIRARTNRPFGIGFVTHNLEASEATFVAALEERPPVMLFSFGDPSPWLPLARDAGARTICQVQTMEDAGVAVAAGADVLAVQGNESGGHSGGANLLPFLVQAVEAFPELPILAAGGITSGRALAAVLAAGAEGAWMGTLFTAVEEADEMSPVHKEAVIASNGRDTVRSEVFDIMNARAFGDLPWPPGVAIRTRRNEFTERWHGKEAELRERAAALADDYVDAHRSVDPSRIPVIFGEGAGAITALRPAEAAIRGVCEEAERLLRERARVVQ